MPNKKKIFILLLLFLIPLSMLATTTTIIPEVSLKLKKNVSTKETQQAQTTTISHKKIQASPTTFLSDLLTQEQSVVRITNNTNDNSQPVLSIRGFGDNAFANSLIVIDGFPLTNTSVLAPAFNAISLADVAKINIIQGSQGSLWGDQAVGGVLKIDTLTPQKPLASATISIGSYNRRLYNLLIGNHFKNGFFFKLSGFSNSTDNYRNHNQQSNQGMSAQLGFDYASGSLTLNTNIYDNKIELPGGLTQQQYDSNPRQAITPNTFNYQTQIYQLIHKQTLPKDWVVETRLAQNLIQTDGFIFTLPYTRHDVLDIFNSTLTGTLFNQRVLLGYEGQTGSFQVTNPSAQQRGDSQQNDLYGQSTIPLFSTLDLTLGARSAWQAQNVSSASQPPMNLNHQVFVSEQGLAYHPSTAWEFFIRRDGNFRFPKANEQTALPVGVGPLLPQIGASYETGTKWQTPLHTIQLSVYRLKLNHEIAVDPTPTAIAPFGSYSNLPLTLRDGITLSQLYHLTEKLTVDTQINYVHARFLGDLHNNNLIPAVPAVNGNLNLSYLFQPHWQVKYTALYTGSRYPSLDLSNTGQKLPGYWLNNIALQYLHKSVNVGFEIDNISNQRYPVFTVYNSSDQTNTYYPGFGRNYFLTTKVFLN